MSQPSENGSCPFSDRSDRRPISSGSVRTSLRGVEARADFIVRGILPGPPRPMPRWTLPSSCSWGRWSRTSWSSGANAASVALRPDDSCLGHRVTRKRPVDLVGALNEPAGWRSPSVTTRPSPRPGTLVAPCVVASSWPGPPRLAVRTHSDHRPWRQRHVGADADEPDEWSRSTRRVAMSERAFDLRRDGRHHHHQGR